MENKDMYFFLAGNSLPDSFGDFLADPSNVILGPINLDVAQYLLKTKESLVSDKMFYLLLKSEALTFYED